MSEATDHDRIVVLERDMLKVKSLKRTLLLTAPCAVFVLAAIFVISFMVSTSERLGGIQAQLNGVEKRLDGLDQRLTRIETLLLERLPAK